MVMVSQDLYQQFQRYIRQFNAADEEYYRQDVPNEQAEAFLTEQIPFFECPDKELEQMYYFRWWVFRKHIKNTPSGHIITEFLPPVPWSGPENAIVCPACFHIREGRWLADPQHYLKQYIDFWLDGKGDTFAYSSWLAHGVWEYCSIKDDFSFGIGLLPKLTAFFRRREALQRRCCGLYWSEDGRDGMEFSISGSGFRPTLNSYAWADAVAIARLAKLAGQEALHREFAEKADQLKGQIEKLLWDGDFYRTIPAGEEDDPTLPCRPEVPQANGARELVGYIPWYFHLPEGKEQVFRHLLDPAVFYAPCGLTTAEQKHPRFMEAFDHECLWNGPVWPFATSQTLVAAANVLRADTPDGFTREDYYQLLLQYARCQHITDERGTHPWIDENLHPYTGTWIARDILQAAGWQKELGGLERGKDYNHSLFCDLILSGLLGIHLDNGSFAADPLIPESWDHFRVEGLCLKGKRYGIYYDKTGTRYPTGKGLAIQVLEH